MFFLKKSETHKEFQGMSKIIDLLTKLIVCINISSIKKKEKKKSISDSDGLNASF